MRPLLRYHGGKWILAPWIISNLPPHRVYVEPFGGAASVLLRKPRSFAEVYNDLDGEIVNLFRVVRERPSELTRAVAWTPFSREEYREAFEPTDDPLTLAKRMLVRSFMGFGSNAVQRSIKSGFRATGARAYTSAAHDWATYPKTIRSVARRFRGVTIENKPAADVVAQQDGPDTLFYLDPPYVAATRSTRMNGHHGYAHEMTDVQHEELAAQLASVKGMVVLSGYRGALYERLYEGWRSVEIATYGDGGDYGKTERVEVLWFNPAAWAASHNAEPLFAGRTA